MEISIITEISENLNPKVDSSENYRDNLASFQKI